jgi:hypothetical protein
MIKHVNLLKILQIYLVLCITFQMVSILFFDYIFFDLILVFSAVASFVIYIYFARKTGRYKLFPSFNNYPFYIYFIIFNQFLVLLFYLLMAKHNTSDAINLNDFYSLYDNNYFTKGFVNSCPSANCPSSSFYPILSFSLIKIVSIFIHDSLFAIYLLTACLAFVIIPLQLLKLEYFFSKQLNKLNVLPLFFLIFNMTLLSSASSTHLAFLFALTSLLLFVSLFLEIFLKNNQLIKSKAYFPFFLFVMIFLFYAHPTILFSFFTLFILISFLHKTFFSKQLLFQFIAASLTFLIFAAFVLSRNAPILNQINSQFSATNAYFLGSYSPNENMTFSIMHFFIKLLKLFVTNSFFNLISILLLPLVFILALKVKIPKIAFLLSICALLSLDFYFFNNLFNSFDLIPREFELILQDLFNTLTYGNYYRLNLLKAFILFYILIYSLNTLKKTSNVRILNIYLSFIYLINLFLTFKMINYLSY